MLTLPNRHWNTRLIHLPCSHGIRESFMRTMDICWSKIWCLWKNLLDMSKYTSSFLKHILPFYLKYHYILYVISRVYRISSVYIYYIWYFPVISKSIVPGNPFLQALPFHRTKRARSRAIPLMPVACNKSHGPWN